MKTISADFLTELQSAVPHVAFLSKIVRADGNEIYLTGHDRAITFDGDSYQPVGDDIVSILRATASTEADNADIKIAYKTGIITRADILGRRFDGAIVENYLVNYDDPDNQNMRLPTGIIGRTVARDHDCSLEILGISQKLKMRIGESTSPGCRAELGDTRCKVTLDYYVEYGVVLAVEGRYRFAAALVERHGAESGHEDIWSVGGSNWFSKGVVTWDADIDDDLFEDPTTGDQLNDGLQEVCHTYMVSAWTPLGTVPIFNLEQSMPFEIQVGDKFQVSAGCLKSKTVCVDKFDNYDNFQGEPDLPGRDRAHEYPDLSV